MRNLKKNWYLAAIIAATVILAIIAVVTAVRLYQVGKEPVAPTAPKPAPAVAPQCQLTFTLATPTPTTATPTPEETPTPIPECWEECTDDTDCPGGLVCDDVDGTDLCINPECEIEEQEETCVCPEPTATPTESPTPTPTGTVVPTATPTPEPTATPPPGCWDTCTDDDDCSGSLVCQTVAGVNRCVNASCPTESDCTCAIPVTPTPTPVELPEAGFALPTIGAILGGLLLIITSLVIIF